VPDIGLGVTGISMPGLHEALGLPLRHVMGVVADAEYVVTCPAL
jgi:hypothetical protein